MEGLPACDKCGLKSVRYELERHGIIVRFCDTCYWGEGDVSGGAAGAGGQGEERVDPAAPEGR